MKISIPCKKETSENIIPLINVVFLLLIFFMLSAKLTPHATLEIVPPISSIETEEEQHSGSILYLYSNGTIVYVEREFDLAQLITYLNSQVAAQPISKLVIKADAQTPADVLLRLLTALRDTHVGQVELLAQSQS
jgi:biopolymer transport protein ExbD